MSSSYKTIQASAIYLWKGISRSINFLFASSHDIDPICLQLAIMVRRTIFTTDEIESKSLAPIHNRRSQIRLQINVSSCRFRESPRPDRPVLKTGWLHLPQLIWVSPVTEEVS
jgi:hypothetical protein